MLTCVLFVIFYQTLIATFKNSLIYTACATQVTIFLDENAGGHRASMILMATFAFLAVIFQSLKKEVLILNATLQKLPTWVEWRATLDTLASMVSFTLDISSNLATQMVSSMTAATVSDAVRGADGTLWSLLGALLCIILLWLLTTIVERKRT